MAKARNILCHVTVILSLMILAFMVLDRFNPTMGFLKNTFFQVALAVLCASCIAQSILTWKLGARSKKQ